MNSRATIDQFLEIKELAVVGVSRNPKKFGYIIFKTLRMKGYRIFPVNPNTNTIEGVDCYNEISTLPSNLSNILIVTHKTQSEHAVSEAIKKGFKNIWIQQTCETDAALKIARIHNVNLVIKACILMYLEPTGFHKFHKSIYKLTGKYITD